MVQLSIEFETLILCSRAKIESNLLEIIQRKIDCKLFDWKYFLKLACFHREIPVVHETMRSFEIKTELKNNLNRIYKKANYLNCQQSLELIEIHREFSINKIDCLAVKGPWLSQRIHRNLSLRQSKDLDLFIAPESYFKAHKILLKLGYNLSFEDSTLISKEQESTLFERTKDKVYYHSQKKIILELHFRLTPSLLLFPLSFEDAWKSRQEIIILGHKIPGLGFEQLWSYQCYHGCRTGWYRLHWLSDIYYLFTERNINWERLFQRMKLYNSQIPFLESLLLLNKLFKIDIPSNLKNNFKEIKKASLLARKSLQHIKAVKVLKSTHRLTRMPLVHGYLQYLSAIPYEFCPNKNEILRRPLPDSMFNLYYPLKILYKISGR